jgi:hypothetical protein
MLLELAREARTEPVGYVIENQCTHLLAGFASRRRRKTAIDEARLIESA